MTGPVGNEAVGVPDLVRLLPPNALFVTGRDPAILRAVLCVFAGGLLASELLLADIVAPVPEELTEVVADIEGFDTTSGEAFCVDGVLVDTADRPDEPSAADTLPVVPPCLVDAEVSEIKRPLFMVLLANLSTSIPASIASTMSSSAVTIEAGNTRNSATTDDATWLALSVKTFATHISPEAHVPMSTFVRMEIGLGKPVRAGINSTTSLVPPPQHHIYECVC